MRILVISDIHGNLTALETVLEDAGDFDAAWCLGDIVGYGPDPNECIELVRSLPGLVCVLGNHDAAIIDEVDVSAFNPEARISIEWTRSTVKPDNVHFLAELPKSVAIDRVTIVHGSPRAPTYEYLLHVYTAALNFAFFDTDFAFFGHTHVPSIFQQDGDYADLLVPERPSTIQLEPRLMINPGSVGQPRDRDARAAYAVFDTATDSWDYRRIEYDFRQVQDRMRQLRLPDRHIQRLGEGW